MTQMIKALPWGLIWLRIGLGPVLGWLIWIEASALVQISVFVIAFFSDVYDGILARKVGVVTAALRRTDSLADTIFYCCLAIGLFWRYPQLWGEHWPGLALLIGLEVIRFAVDFRKFGQMAAYHMWSAKAWGISLLLGVLEVLLTKRAGFFFQTAILLGIVTDIEGLLASFVLPTWEHDVPSLWHAVARRNAARIQRPPS